MTSDKPEPPWPWPPGSATGAGSMPGTDPVQAVRTVLDELPGLPHLPELPARGPGADMIGRTASLLTDLPVETTPAGWRLARRPGRDLRRARDLLEADLDALTDAADGYQGPLKVQASGPWTLAAGLELPASQDVALADRGAVADLAASLAEGVAAHLAAVAARVPGARLLLQLDEPALPSVLAGAVPTASGWRRLPAVPADDATERLRAVLGAGPGQAIVHCCASHVPFGIIMKSGARGVWFDLGQLRREDEDPLAEAVESGLGIFAGAIKPVSSERPEAGQMATRVTALLGRLGLLTPGRAGQVVIGPACGLAGVSPERAAAVLTACREAGRRCAEMIEEGSA